MARSPFRNAPRSVRWLARIALMSAAAACTEQGGDLGSAGSQIDKNWGSDPCKGAVATIVGKDHKFIGTDGDDVIIGTEGADEIWGNGGNDTICALGGEDVIHGGDGNDYIDGGDGNDTIDGGDGNDLIHGRGGSDLIHGGAGNDLLFGDILDDKIFGDEGNDILIGGHGVDHMDGGPGNDWLRGDTNGDDFIGGPGTDTASFTTAMPPGQPQGNKNAPSTINGVVVDFQKGTVSGDGVDEPIDGIERVIGSSFNDSFLHVGNHTIVPGYGNDTCDGAPCGGGLVAAAHAFVALTPETTDLGLLILGTTNDDHLHIGTDGHTVKVVSTDGQKLAAGPGCHALNATALEVDCAIDQDDALRFIMGYGDKGNDRFDIDGDLPRDITVHISGGEGDDTLIGGDEQDVFFTGPTGQDVLRGNGGDDALISESYDWDRVLGPDQYQGGADTLDGGSGNDQLVVDYPCGAHHYTGGPGNDIAGFARSAKIPLTAQLGGIITDEKNRMPFYGRSFNAQCATNWQTYATTIDGDCETLEGTDADDELHGDDADNVIWGRDGNDLLLGHGGDDVISGALGSDTIYGGTGHDKLEGGGDYDYLYANDGEADLELSCGDGGGELVTHDGHDPASSNCKVGGALPHLGNAVDLGGGSQGSGSSSSGGGNTQNNGGCSGDDFALPGLDPDHCYRVITARTWDQAHDQCQAVSMHLATLSDAENDALTASNEIGTATWIGGHRNGATKQFYWVQQSETFPGNAPWYSQSEANDSNGDRCVTFLQNGQWGLRDCADSVQALCETF